MAIVGILGQTGGGGISFPSTPSAGDTPIYLKTGAHGNVTGSTYAEMGAGWGVVANVNAVLRVKYCGTANYDSYGTKLKLRKNGVDVTGSEIIVNGTGVYGPTVMKEIDIEVSAGDTVKLWKSTTTSFATAPYFVVSILAADVQDAIDEIITPTT